MIKSKLSKNLLDSLGVIPTPKSNINFSIPKRTKYYTSSQFKKMILNFLKEEFIFAEGSFFIEVVDLFDDYYYQIRVNKHQAQSLTFRIKLKDGTYFKNYFRDSKSFDCHIFTFNRPEDFEKYEKADFKRLVWGIINYQLPSLGYGEKDRPKK